jgi:heat shock protein HslJ
MSDEQMDARLRHAGEAWRAATDTSASAPADGEPLPLVAPAGARRRFRRTGLLASAAVVAAALVAGGAVLVADLAEHHRQLAASPLERTVWLLSGYDRQVSRDGSTATLSISDGKLVADDECAVIGAQVVVTSTRLTVAPLDVRPKGCVDTYTPSFIDPRAAEILAAEPNYAIDSDTLTITGAGHTMRLLAKPDLPAPTLDVPTLAGTDWRLASATDAGGTTTAVSAASGGLELRVENGRYTVEEGCNKLSGGLTDEGSQAQIKTVTSTTLPCPSPQLYEQVIQSVFRPGTVRTQVLGGQLTVSRAGAGTLQYRWVPAAHDATDRKNLLGSDWDLISVAGEQARPGTHMYISPTREFSITYGCGAVGGTLLVGAGTLSADGIQDGPAAGCSGAVGDESSTIDSFFASGSALWRIQDRRLIVYSSGAQSFSVVFRNSRPPQPAPRPLVGTNWALERIMDADKNELPIAGNATLLIDSSGHLIGNDGCNSISGDVTHDGKVIHVGTGLSTTEMACADPQVTSTAATVDAVLSGDVAWYIDGDQLALTKDGVGTLVYKAQAAPTKSTDPADLRGVTWQLTTIESGSVAHTVIGEPTLRIDGALVYTDACNKYSGTPTVGAGTLDIDITTGSAVGCIGAAGEQAGEIGAVLKGEVSWMIEGDQLTIRKVGVGALGYTKAADNPEPTDRPMPSSTASDLPLIKGLAGPTWRLTGIEQETATGGGASGSSDMGTEVRFDGAGHVTITQMCGVDQGDVQIAPATLTITNVHVVQAHSCPRPSDEQRRTDESVRTVLDGESSWAIRGGQLSIKKENTTLDFTAS